MALVFDSQLFPIRAWYCVASITNTLISIIRLLTLNGKSFISPIEVLVAPSAVMILMLAAQSTQQPNWSISCHVIMLSADPLFRISLMCCLLTLASVYIAVMSFDFRAALLNSGVSTGFLSSKKKITISNLSSVMVVSGILLVSDCFCLVSKL
ncbi:hypothetical protein G9A89_008195 [Geosiphon pyriformis]|nr:hypothetical protein G9A89_008195 [Geosiphon pyriformis]